MYIVKQHWPSRPRHRFRCSRQLGVCHVNRLRRCIMMHLQEILIGAIRYKDFKGLWISYEDLFGKRTSDCTTRESLPVAGYWSGPQFKREYSDQSSLCAQGVDTGR